MTDAAANARLRAMAWWLVVVVAFAAATVLLFHAAWVAPASSVVGPATVDAPGYGGLGLANADHEQTVWFLRSTDWALRHGRSPLSSDRIDWPWGVNLMWNTAVPLAGIVAWPLTATAGPVVASNVLLTAAVAFAGVAATALARRLAVPDGLALLAGALYAYSPFMVAHSQAHLDITLGGALLPLFLLVGHELVVRRRWPAAVTGGGLGALVGAELYLSAEMLVVAVLVSALVGVAVVAVCRRPLTLGLGYVVSALRVAAVVAGVVAAPGIAVLVAGPQRVTETVRPPGTYVTDLANLVVPTWVQAIAPSGAVSLSHRFSGNSVEWTGYLGIPLLALGSYVVVAGRRCRAVRILGLVGIAVLLLSLGPTLHVAGRDTTIPLPWAAVQRLPLVADVLPARLSAALALVAALLVAVGLSPQARWSGRPGPAAATLAAILAVVALAPSPTLPAALAPTPPFFTSGAVTRISPGSVALVAPWARHASPAPMLWQALADMRFVMPEGYALVPRPDGPPGEEPPPTATSRLLVATEADGSVPLDPALVAAVRAELTRWSVATVLVGPMRHRDAAIAAFTAILKAPPEEEGGVAVWWDVPRLIRGRGGNARPAWAGSATLRGP